MNIYKLYQISENRLADMQNACNSLQFAMDEGMKIVSLAQKFYANTQPYQDLKEIATLHTRVIENLACDFNNKCDNYMASLTDIINYLYLYSAPMSDVKYNEQNLSEAEFKKNEMNGYVFTVTSNLKSITGERYK